MNSFFYRRIVHHIKAQNLLRIKLIVIGLLIGLTVFAKEKNNTSKPDTLDYSWERFSVNFGGFLTGLNSDIQLGSQKVGLGLIVKSRATSGGSDIVAIIIAKYIGFRPN